MAAKIGGWLLYCAIIAAVLFIGWQQPLRFRFLSPAEIENIVHPPPPPPPPTPPPDPTKATPPPGAWMKDPARKNPFESPIPGSSRGPR